MQKNVILKNNDAETTTKRKEMCRCVGGVVGVSFYPPPPGVTIINNSCLLISFN